MSDEPFYARNASLFVLPLLAVYFAWKRGLGRRDLRLAGAGLRGRGRFRQCLPFRAQRSDTEMLTALHLPIALWLVVGVAYVGGRWFAGGRRMDFVRFSGELFIYYVLIAFGGGVLTAFTMMMFAPSGSTPSGWPGLVDPVRRDGRRHRRILAGGGEAKRH